MTLIWSRLETWIQEPTFTRRNLHSDYQPEWHFADREWMLHHEGSVCRHYCWDSPSLLSARTSRLRNTNTLPRKSCVLHWRRTVALLLFSCPRDSYRTTIWVLVYYVLQKFLFNFPYKYPQQLVLSQTRARSPELNLHVPCEWRGLSPWTVTAASCNVH